MLGNFQCLTNLDNSREQGLTAPAIGAVWGCLNIFFLLCHFLSPIRETDRYRLKYYVSTSR